MRILSLALISTLALVNAQSNCQTGNSVSNSICSLIYQEGTQDQSCNIINADGSTTLQCYNPKCYTCTSTGQLCPTSASNACGVACYDPHQYSCNVNSANFFASTLVQIPGGSNVLRLPDICPGSGSPLAGTNGTVSQPANFGTGAFTISSTAAPSTVVAATTQPPTAAAEVVAPIFITLPPQTAAAATVAVQAEPQAPTTSAAPATVPATQAAVITQAPATVQQTQAPTPTPTVVVAQPTSTSPAQSTIPPSGQAVETNVCAAIYQEGDQDSTCNVASGSGFIVQCYNPACYTCNSDNTLCPANAPNSCNGACYDSGLFTCQNGQLQAISGGHATASLPAKCPGSGSPLAGQSGTSTVTLRPGQSIGQQTSAPSTQPPTQQATQQTSLPTIVVTEAPTTASNSTSAKRFDMMNRLIKGIRRE